MVSNEAENESDDTTRNKQKTKRKDISLLAYLKNCDLLNVLSLLISLVSISIILFIGVDECKRCFNHRQTLIENALLNDNNQRHDSNSISSLMDVKIFKPFGKNLENGYLKHVFAVLGRMGYQSDPDTYDWDLLWSHEYPFRVLRNELLHLKPHQRVNHFPGCGYLTNKVELATTDLKYILPAFKLPDHKEKLLDFANSNPDKKFVVKNNEHRHVKVKEISEISLDDNNTFVQEFIDKPLLIDGHMFDIGIYTIITSIDPLRVYVYNGDVLLRFCPQKYHPFDSNNLDKYVVGDDYLPIWEVPGLKNYYTNLGFGMRDSLNAYLKSQNRNPSVIWKQIEESIQLAILAKHELIASVTERFSSKRNFFEMTRIDFIVDENLGVHLMEANMSPNLSSAHFKANTLLYEQVLFNLFGLVGVGERFGSSSGQRTNEERAMQGTVKNIAVFQEKCSSETCQFSCEPLKCNLCKQCWSEELKADLLQAHYEHLNRGDCKRIFPVPMETNEKGGNRPDNFLSYSRNNKLMHLWFQEKCNMDNTWCI